MFVLMGKIDPALAASFILRVQEQMRWLETRLEMLSPGSDSLASEQQAIAGAMNELRSLMQVASLTNYGDPI